MPRIPPYRPGYAGPDGYGCDPDLVDREVLPPVCPDCPTGCPAASPDYAVGTGATLSAAATAACATCRGISTRCTGHSLLPCGLGSGGCYVDEENDCQCADGLWSCIARACCELPEGSSAICDEEPFALVPESAEGLVSSRPFIDISPPYNDPVMKAIRESCDLNYDLFNGGTFVDLFSAFERTLGVGWVANFMPVLCYCVNTKYDEGFLKPVIRKFDKSGLPGGGTGGINETCASTYPWCYPPGSSGIHAHTQPTLIDAAVAAYDECETDGVCPPPALHHVMEWCGCVLLSCWEDEGTGGGDSGFKCEWQKCCNEVDAEIPGPPPTTCSIEHPAEGCVARAKFEGTGANAEIAGTNAIDICTAAADPIACKEHPETNCGCIIFDECRMRANGTWECTAQACCKPIPEPTCTTEFVPIDPDCSFKITSEYWTETSTTVDGARLKALTACNDTLLDDYCDCPDFGLVQCAVPDPPACMSSYLWCRTSGGGWECDAYCCCKEYDEEFSDCEETYDHEGSEDRACGKDGRSYEFSPDDSGAQDNDLGVAKDLALLYATLQYDADKCADTAGWVNCDTSTPPVLLERCEPTHEGFRDSEWKCWSTLCCKQSIECQLILRYECVNEECGDCFFRVAGATHWQEVSRSASCVTSREPDFEPGWHSVAGESTAYYVAYYGCGSPALTCEGCLCDYLLDEV